MLLAEAVLPGTPNMMSRNRSVMPWPKPQALKCARLNLFQVGGCPLFQLFARHAGDGLAGDLHSF